LTRKIGAPNLINVRIWTIGHSTRTLAELLSLLEENGVRTVADIRSFPASRAFPHFGRENLERELPRAGLEYVWLGRELGGFRPKSDSLGDGSPNGGLRSEAFRRYADYMLGAAFQGGIRLLLDLAARSETAIMCAEKLYWRCHRLLVSDCLVSRGVEVRHIIDPGRWEKHALSKAARLAGGGLTYPPEDASGTLPLA
jgi:uncharacterized protein (DUF488 family)